MSWDAWYDVYLGGIPFSAVTFEVSFLSVITLLPVSVIYHLKAYVVNFQNSHIILIWLPWQCYYPSDWLNMGTDVTINPRLTKVGCCNPPYGFSPVALKR